MELQQLKSFIKMSEELNFSKVAKMMHITQSTMSIRIQNLEKELGVSLFYRSGREVCLSSYGEILLPYAKKCMQIIDDGQRKIKEEKEKNSSKKNNKIRFGITQPFAMSIFPRLLPDIYLTFPDFYIEVLRTERSTDIVKMVQESNIEIGFVNNIELQNLSDADQLSHFHLFESPMILASSCSHPYSKYDEIPVSYLADQKLISLGSSTVTAKLIRSYFEREQVTPLFNMEINHIEAILRLIDTQPFLFLTLLPDLYLKQAINSGKLIAMNVTPKPPSLVISIVYKPDSRLEKLVDFISNKVKSLTMNT